MPVSGALTILHISDMQFGRNFQFRTAAGSPTNEYDSLRERIWDDIEKLGKDEGIHPDLLICTGDLAEFAWPIEFAEATDFLATLAARLGIKRNRVVIIPGNHDVNRKDCLRYFENCVESGKRIVSPWYPKWGAYQAAFAEFYKDVPEIRFTPDEPWSLFVDDKLKVVIAGLNSTWVEGHIWRDDGSLPDLPDHERPHQFGWCHEIQLRAFATSLAADRFRGWLKIGAVHHNVQRGVIDDEHLRDADDLERHLGRHIHLLMHGHTHRAKIGRVGDALPWFATGSAGLKQEARPYGVPNQYQFLLLDQKGIRVRARFYMPDEKKWADEPRLEQSGRVGVKDVTVDWRDCENFPALESEKGDSSRRKHNSEQEGITRYKRVASEADAFLERARECYEVRYPSALIEPIRREELDLGYLRVRANHNGIVEQFPVGVSERRPDANGLQQFADLVLAQYRTVDPQLRAHYVYGGLLRAESETKLLARGIGIDLRSFIEAQGLIDFRDYLARQNNRLTRDDNYPPRLYVPQIMEYEAGGQRGSTDDALKQALAWITEPDPRFVLILGDFGTGKTFLLREIARTLGSQVDAPTPLLIELRALEKAQKLDLLLAQHFALHGFDRLELSTLRYMMKQGRVVLLFDGFDELALRIGYEKAADHLGTLIEAAEGDARVVVTCRTSYFENEQQTKLALGRHVERLRGLRYCRLQNFNPSQIRRFLVNTFGSDVEADAWFRLLTDVRDLLGLGENPRMLSFICKLTRGDLEEARRHGPITAAELYRLLLVKHWFGYELGDRRHPPGVPSLLTAEQWLDPATDLAVMLWTRVDRWLAQEALRVAVRAALTRYAPDKLSSLEEAVHAIGSGTLFIRDEEGRFTFVHQSVLEWLVARRVAEQLVLAKASPLLEAAEISDLMADFLLDIAVRSAVDWRERATSGREPHNQIATSNALTLLFRHGERLRESVKHGDENARLAAEEERSSWLLTVGTVKGPDFHGADLRGKGFSGKFLRGADLSGADLRDALLEDCDLSGANLKGARLNGAICDGAKFVEANLESVDADGCSALKANFNAATIDAGKWRRARLIGAQLTENQKERMDLWAAAMDEVEEVEIRWPSLSSKVNAIALNPGGSLMAIGQSDGSIRVCNALSGDELRVLRGHTASVNAVAWSPDGTCLASGSADTTARLWRADSGQELSVLRGHARPVNAVAWSPDGTCLASGSDDETVRFWQTDSGQESRVLRGHTASVNAVAWSPDGTCLASGSWITVRLWRADGEHGLRLFNGSTNAVMALSWSPDGTRLASGSADGVVRLWKSDCGRELCTFRAHTSSVNAVAWSPDGTRLASGSADSTVRLWEPDSGRELYLLRGHTSAVNAVAWSLNDVRLVSGSADETVRFWQTDSGQESRVLKTNSTAVNAVAWSPDGTRLASGSADSTARLWRADSGQELSVLRGHARPVNAVAWSPDGTCLASGSADTTARLWRADSGQELSVLRGHARPVNAVAWSPDGTCLASGSDDETVRFWQTDSGQESRVLRGHTASVNAVAWSPDGTCLASGSADTTARLWRADSGQELSVLRGHARPVNAVAWSPDGTCLASGSDDETVRFWQTDSGQESRVLRGHTASVNAVAWSPDGTCLASGSADTTVRLWAPDSGSCIGIAPHGFAGVQQVSWDSSGRWLITSASDGVLRIWDASVLLNAELSSKRLLDRPVAEPVTMACAAMLFANGNGWIAARTSGRFRFGGDAAKWTLFGSRLCRFTVEEVLALFPERLLAEDDPLTRVVS